MIKKAISRAMLALLILGMLALALNNQLISAHTDVAMNLNDCGTVGEVRPISSDLCDNLRNHHFSTHAYEWDFNNINKWVDFAKIDSGSVEIVIGVNQAKPNSYDELKHLIAENHGELVDTVSIEGKLIAIVADIPLSMAPSFAQRVRVAELSRYIEPNLRFQLLFTPDDPDWGEQWGPKKIEADYAWNTTMGDPLVLVAVIDTGIYYNHPDLQANYVAKGRDWVNEDNDPLDDEGHGTHCSGIIAATTNNCIGIAGLAQVQIMAEKAFSGAGVGYARDIAPAIIHAVNKGADILSNSWGGYVYSSLIHEAIQYAYNNGVLVIASAGNEATSQRSFPAGYKEVIAVTATTESDTLASSFSNYGDWVELAAPGDDIYSTYGPGGYLSLSGTSMACPHVAGVAALGWSQFQDKTRDWLRLWLRYTADDLGDEGFDEYYGYGRINARKAVEESPPDHDVLIVSWEKTSSVEPGNPVTVGTKVLNFGAENESSVTVQLLVNGTVENSTTIDSLKSGQSATVSCSWTPASLGIYNITSYVVPVSGETRVKDNAMSGPVFVGIKTIRVPANLPTIQEAVDAADTGFTILVDNGTYIESVLVDKSLSLVGEGRDNTTIRGGGSYGMVLHVLADNVNITGFTVEHSGTEGEFYSGICLDEVSNCSVYDNSLTDNTIGISAWECSACSVYNNNFTTNNNYGVFAYNCTTCSISENTIKDNSVGVVLNYSSRCSVFRNSLESNEAGLWLNLSLHCSVFTNDFVENNYGIKLTESMDNRIIHNSFLNSTYAQAYVDGYANIWDDGYPRGGNYWSNHEVEDLYSGPYQDESGSDGILDVPYTIDLYNNDTYPLKKPFDEFSHDIAVLNVTTPEAQIGGGQTVNITITVENLGDIVETFDVTAHYNETSIGTETVLYVIPGGTDTVNVSWNSVGVPLGNYTIKAEASQVLGETILENNLYVDGTVEIIPAHNVAITSIALSRDVVYSGIACSITINATALNKGTFNETFNVILYADKNLTVIGDEILIGNKTVPLLTNATSITITFTWDTAGVAKGVYAITAKANPVPSEAETTDNILTDGVVQVVIPGDVNVDGTCNMKDIYQLIRHYTCSQGQPCYVPNYDINCDGTINMKDVYVAIRHFGETDH